MRVNLCLLAEFTRGKCFKRTAGKHDQVGFATEAVILNAISADRVLEPVPGIFVQCHLRILWLFWATTFPGNQADRIPSAYYTIIDI